MKTRFQLSTLACSMIGLLAFSCSAPEPSDVKGHFEKSDQASFTAALGKQVVRPEYLPAEGVVISGRLLDALGRDDIVSALLESDIQSLYVMAEPSMSHDIDSIDWSMWRMTAGKRLDSIRIIRQSTSVRSIWARDWAPLTAVRPLKGSEPAATVLLDFNYHANRPTDDAVPELMQIAFDLPRVSVPVYNEGGNFMVDSAGNCFMAARVTEANAYSFNPEDFVLDEDQIKTYYRLAAGCTRVTIFPRMPYEGTGHIDMWAKFLDDRTVLVNQLEESTLSLVTSDTGPNQYRDVQRFLEERSQDFAALGYTVVRIPMPAPVIGLLFRSYTNSLVLNGRALVPVYRKSGFPDESLLAHYEEVVRNAYESAGYTFVPLPSDDLILSGGAIHCVTMQVGVPTSTR